MRRSPLALVTFAALAQCGGAQTQASRRAPAPAARPSLSPAPSADPGGPAWLEHPLDASRAGAELRDGARAPSLSLEAELVAVGSRTSLLKTRFGLFILHDRDGVSGPYTAPTREGVGLLDGEDTVYFVDVHNRVHAGKRVSDGAPKDLAPRGQVPFAQHWAAGGGRLVAIAGPEVFVSEDGGAKFQSSRPMPTLDLVSVHASGTGVIVVQANDGSSLQTSVSADGGNSWAKAPALSQLESHGGWIFAEDNSCTWSTPTAAVLANDGKTWVAVEPIGRDTRSNARSRAEWTLVAEGLAQATIAKPSLSLEHPPAPAATLPKYPGYPACRARGGGRSAKRVKIIEGAAAPKPDCEGVGCLRGQRLAPALPTATRAYLLQDAQCAIADAVESTELCKPGAVRTRGTTALFADDIATGALHPAATHATPTPKDCVAQFITFGRGIVLLGCARAKGTTLYSATADRTWHQEAELADSEQVSAADLELAPDGSAMLAWYDAKSLASKAWVRAPLALGSASAWREVTRPLAMTYFLLAGGVVEIVELAAKGDWRTFSVLRDAPGEPPRAVVERAKLVNDLRCFGHKEGLRLGVVQTASKALERVEIDATGVHPKGPIKAGSWASDRTGACGL